MPPCLIGHYATQQGVNHRTVGDPTYLFLQSDPAIGFFPFVDTAFQ